tara:strand:+ start:422 stop:610 length:189 start_codon:yes stop_codon:yes gene_type:complete
MANSKTTYICIPTERLYMYAVGLLLVYLLYKSMTPKKHIKHIKHIEHMKKKSNGLAGDGEGI